MSKRWSIWCVSVARYGCLLKRLPCGPRTWPCLRHRQMIPKVPRCGAKSVTTRVKSGSAHWPGRIRMARGCSGWSMRCSHGQPIDSQRAHHRLHNNLCRRLAMRRDAFLKSMAGPGRSGHFAAVGPGGRQPEDDDSGQPRRRLGHHRARPGQGLAGGRCGGYRDL